MNERNDPPSLQNMFSQVLREIQTGINKLEQTMNQATQNPSRPGGGGFPPVDASASTPYQAESRPQSTPKTPAEPYNGPRWEYRVAYINFRGQISSEGEQVIIGKGERRSTFVREYLDELGQQGWELSGVSPLGETENSYFVFKRPAAAKSPSKPDSKIKVEEVDEGTTQGPASEL